MFTKILLIVLISAVLVQAQVPGQKINLTPEQKEAFIADVMSRLSEKLQARSRRDIASDAYHDVMDAVKDRLEERLEEGLNFSCVPFSGGF